MRSSIRRTIAVLAVLTSPLLATDADARLSQNDRRAVVLEAFYALRPSYDGGSDTTIGVNCAGSWNYLVDDLHAYDFLKKVYGCNASLWRVHWDVSGCWGDGPTSFFDNPWGYGYGEYGGSFGPVGRGGQCKFFANLILYRSGADQRIFPYWPDMWDSSTDDFGRVREGDVILTYGQGITNHVAVVVEIKHDWWGISGLDVIDSNWLTDNGQPDREVIGRHLLPLKKLQKYYRIWTGAAYYNEPYDPWQ